MSDDTIPAPAPSPDKMADDVVDEHERRLRSYATTLFYGETGDMLEIDPVFSTVMIGLYLKAKRFPAKQRKVKPFPQHQQTMKPKYLLSVDTKPLAIEADPDRTAPDIDYLVGDWTPAGRSLLIPLLHWSTLADFSVDDVDELSRCGLPQSWAYAFGEMTTDTRAVYQTAVGSIRDVPPALRSVKPVKFLRTMAAHGTYESLLGGYYPKWQPGKELKGPFPVTFTDAFIKGTTSEVELEAGQDYVLVTSALTYQLFQITRLERGDLAMREVLAGYESWHKEVNWQAPRTVVLFHAVDGEKAMRKRSQRIHKVNEAAPQRLLLDPRGMVEALVRGQDGAEGGALLELNDSDDWFVEMCIAHFREPIYPIDFSTRGLQPGAASLEMLRKETAATVRYFMDGLGKVGELSEKLSAARRAEVEALLERPGLVVFPQGMPVGETALLVGADESWIYLRDMTSGSVYALPLHEFVDNYRVAVIARDVYAGSRGILPLLGLLFATAALAFAAPVVVVAVEAAVGAGLVRTAIRELTVKEVTSLAIRRVVKFMLPAIVAEMTTLVIQIFEYGGLSNDLSRRWKAFAQGFFTGYLAHTLYDEFYRKLILGTLTRGPKEYRTYVMVKRVYAAVDKVREVVKTLEEELDEKSVRRGVKLFEKAATSTVHGSLFLLSALYYSEHGDMAAVLDGFAGTDGVDAPDDETWNYESSQQIVSMAHSIGEQLASMDDLLGALRGSVPLKIGIAAVIFSSDSIRLATDVAKRIGRSAVWLAKNQPEKLKQLEKKVGKALTHPTVLKVVGGLLLVSGVIHEVATDGAGTKKVGAGLETAIEVLSPLLEELVTQWPGSTETRARVHGELAGAMLGSIMFNRFLLGSGDEIEAAKAAKHPHAGQQWLKLVDSPVIGSSLKRNLKIGFIGPLLKVLLKRYISLYEQVRKEGHFDGPERTEELVGKFMSVAEDAELADRGFERLTAFRTHEESVSFSLTELVKVLFRLRTMVGRDLADYLERRWHRDHFDLKQVLPEEIGKLVSAADTLGLAELMEKHAGQMFIVMSTHLLMAFHELESALRDLFEEFTNRRKGWMHLLKEFGLDLGNLDDALTEMNTSQRDRYKPFMTGQGAGSP